MRLCEDWEAELIEIDQRRTLSSSCSAACCALCWPLRRIASERSLKPLTQAEQATRGTSRLKVDDYLPIFHGNTRKTATR